MKKTSLLALAVAIAAAAAGCKALVRSLTPYVERWTNGLTKREGRLEGDTQTGEWTYYYESGQRRSHGRYDSDHQVGPWTYWFENGGVEWSGAFDATGKRTGEWTFFHADSTMRARGRYVADFEDGPWEFFAADGSRERAGQYDKGLMSGPWAYFHAGGKPKAEGLCLRGQRLGIWTITDESGKATAQDFGTRAGAEIALDKWPSGARRRSGVLQNGAPVGRWTSWHENGAQRFCCTMNGAQPSGVFELRNAQGNVIASGLVADGKVADGTIAAGALPAVPADLAAWTAEPGFAALKPEVAVALCSSELASPIDAAARAPTVAPPSLPTASPAAVAAIEQQPERVPAPMQSNFTVQQEKDLAGILQNYLEGPSATRLSLKKYPTDTGKPAAAPASGLGPRPLTALEGKPFPIEVLTGVDGKKVDLRDYRGKKGVLLVVLRGFLGEVCVYCVAQTEALAQCRTELEALGIEVLVLYPGPKENEQAFEQAYAQTFGKGAPPYRVFYDPDLQIVARLGIAGDLAYPTTFILDEQGIVRYAYVGKDRADRPAAKALIKKIKEMKQ